MIDHTLASYSDWTYGGAVGVYVLAMFLYLVEQAFGRRTKGIESARAKVLAGAGGPETEESTDTTTAEPPAEPERDGRAERFGRMAVALTVLGAGLHVVSLVLRAAATGRAPWGNMYEYGAAGCAVAVITWLVLVRRFPVRRLGVFVLLPVVVLMFLGGVVFYADAAPVQPSLQSYWMVIHVSLIASGSGMLLVPGVASVLYLLKVRRPGWLRRLPAADVLDRIAYRTTIFAFPVYTIGVICGAIWAEEAWGRFWGWDPKETVAFVAWVVYAAYLHSRATAGWRGGRAAAINVVGFAVMIFNLFFINLVVSGLHSYAGT
jgi:cytochrome c-type biogenesis protein CcsB